MDEFVDVSCPRDRFMFMMYEELLETRRELAEARERLAEHDRALHANEKRYVDGHGSPLVVRSTWAREWGVKIVTSVDMDLEALKTRVQTLLAANGHGQATVKVDSDPPSTWETLRITSWHKILNQHYIGRIIVEAVEDVTGQPPERVYSRCH